MDGKERGILSLKQENDYYKMENDFFKKEFIKLIGMIPSIQNGGFTEEEIDSFKVNSSSEKSEALEKEVQKLQEEVEELKKNKEVSERQNINLVNENSILNAKLTNLENVFIGSDIMIKKDGSVFNDIG